MGFFKDLIFVNEDDKDKKKVEVVAQDSFKSKFPSSNGGGSPTSETSFPTQSVTTMAPITPENPACGPHLDKIMTLYEQGFDSLNQDGYDFYEFFKAVIEAGANNPAIYSMALTMAKAMDSKVSKESLLSQSQFYITEIRHLLLLYCR